MNESFRYCPNCGTQNPKEADECLKCGLVFSKFKPLSITFEKGKREKPYFLILILAIIFISFLSYIIVVLLIERDFLKGNEVKPGIYNLTMDLEMIYKKLPVKDIEQRQKYLKEIHTIEKIISIFPISEDIEKINIFEQNLKDIKEILLEKQEVDDGLKLKIEERFKKLK